jgi:hypothetical protein
VLVYQGCVAARRWRLQQRRRRPGGCLYCKGNTAACIGSRLGGGGQGGKGWRPLPRRLAVNNGSSRRHWLPYTGVSAGGPSCPVHTTHLGGGGCLAGVYVCVVPAVPSSCLPRWPSSTWLTRVNLAPEAAQLPRPLPCSGATCTLYCQPPQLQYSGVLAGSTVQPLGSADRWRPRCSRWGVGVVVVAGGRWVATGSVQGVSVSTCVALHTCRWWRWSTSQPWSIEVCGGPGGSWRGPAAWACSQQHVQAAAVSCACNPSMPGMQWGVQAAACWLAGRGWRGLHLWRTRLRRSHGEHTYTHSQGGKGCKLCVWVVAWGQPSLHPPAVMLWPRLTAPAGSRG